MSFLISRRQRLFSRSVGIINFYRARVDVIKRDPLKDILRGILEHDNCGVLRLADNLPVGTHQSARRQRDDTTAASLPEREHAAKLVTPRIGSCETPSICPEDAHHRHRDKISMLSRTDLVFNPHPPSLLWVDSSGWATGQQIALHANAWLPIAAYRPQQGSMRMRCCAGLVRLTNALSARRRGRPTARSIQGSARRIPPASRHASASSQCAPR